MFNKIFQRSRTFFLIALLLIILLLTRGTSLLSASYYNLGNIGVFNLLDMALFGEQDRLLVDRSKAFFSSAVHLTPQNSSALLGKARISMIEDDLPAAQDAFSQINDPYHLTTKWLTGNVLYEMGDEASAIELWQQAGAGYQIFNWGQIAIGDEYWQNPFSLNSVILELDPDNPDAYYKLALINVRRGNLESAEGNVKQALTIKPHVWYYHLLLGRIYDKLGSLQHAKGEYEFTLSQNPALTSIRNRLNRLEAEIEP